MSPFSMTGFKARFDPDSLRHHFSLNLHLRHRHASSSKSRFNKPNTHSKPPATPYQRSSRPPRPPTEDPPPSNPASLTRRTKRQLRPYIIVACGFVFSISAYIGILYAQLRSEPLASSDPSEQDNSLTLRYDTTASEYDAVVESSEYWQGITRLRREVVGMARGRVLEVCAGTGRNLAFYDFGEKKGWVEGMLGKGGAMTKRRNNKDKDKDMTGARKEEGEEDEEAVDDAVTELICIDRSAAMLDIARAKWAKLHPPPTPPKNTDTAKPNLNPNSKQSSHSDNSTIFEKATFLTQPATAPLPPPSTSSAQPTNPEKFTATIQTFGLCSLPNPALHLLHLASLTLPPSPYSNSNSGGKPDNESGGGKILLLEHGRSHYPLLNSILDRSAARHAARHGCWYNRDIGIILAECEQAGVLVVESVRRPWWAAGTVWVVVARVGPALYT